MYFNVEQLKTLFGRVFRVFFYVIWNSFGTLLNTFEQQKVACPEIVLYSVALRLAALIYIAGKPRRTFFFLIKRSKKSGRVPIAATLQARFPAAHFTALRFFISCRPPLRGKQSLRDRSADFSIKSINSSTLVEVFKR